MNNQSKKNNSHTVSIKIVMCANQDTMMESQNMTTNAHIINITTVMCVIQSTAPATANRSTTMLKENDMQTIHEDSINDIRNIVMNNATHVTGITIMVAT